MSQYHVGSALPEKLRTLKEAAKILGIPCWKLRRAAKAGIFPTYRILNKRKLVRISEIMAVIMVSRAGGQL